MLDAWKRRARALDTELHALVLAYRDPRTPWAARLWTLLVLAYAFSPIDLIPDPIPVLGYLDDLVLVPLGIALALRLIPPPVMVDARARAQAAPFRGPARWVAAGLIALLWLALLVLAARALL